MRISDWSSDVCSSDLVATALEQFALLGVVFDGDGVDRVILRIAQLQSAYLAHQRRTVSLTAVHAVATEAAPFVIAMIERRAAAVLAGPVGGLLRGGGGSLRNCCLDTGGGQCGGPATDPPGKIQVH